jgi:hypothetical protein
MSNGLDDGRLSISLDRVDDRLLEEALAARDLLVEALHHADSARADYHHMIRRLHASGGSTREIARRLGLSHQRVHQIIDVDVDVLPPLAQPPTAPQRRHTGDQDGTTFGDARHKRLFDRLRGDAREVMLIAEEAARALNHDYLGTEHILLGLLGARHSLATRILLRSGADREAVRAVLERIVGQGLEEPPAGPLRLTAHAKKVLSHARKEAGRDYCVHTRAEHLLSGLLRERAGVAARVLADLGVDHDDLRRRIERAGRVCSFCTRSGVDVAHLVAGPTVFICDGCIQDATRLTVEPDPEPGYAELTLVPGDQEDATCDFCGKQRIDVDYLISSPDVSICTECLTICREIHHDEGTGPVG